MSLESTGSVMEVNLECTGAATASDNPLDPVMEQQHCVLVRVAQSNLQLQVPGLVPLLVIFHATFRDITGRVL